jgi:serine protease Do
MDNTPEKTPVVTTETTMETSPNRSTCCGDGPKRCNARVLIVFAIAGALVFGFIGSLAAMLCAPGLMRGSSVPWMRTWWPQYASRENEREQVASKKIDAVSEESAVVDIVKQASPAVVSIVISQDVPQLQRMRAPFGFPFFMMPQGYEDDATGSGNGETTKQTVGHGSGFLVSADGIIVTNKHVVSSASAEYTVMTNTGKEFPATVLARDPNRDIAVLKVEAHDLPFLQFGDSDNVSVGRTVVAIGNSLGEFSNTVSKGIISGLRRNLVAGSGMGESERLSNIIQTDAAINPGNSGGPLLDLSGKVVGVNVAMAEGAQSIGFALPANQIKKIIDQIQSTGKISTAFLGVRYVMLDPDMQKKESLPLDHGALLLRGNKMTDFAVIPGSPADKAGLVENDIILEIDGVTVDNEHQIADSIADKTVGQTVSLRIWHKGEIKTVSVTLEERL